MPIVENPTIKVPFDTLKHVVFGEDFRVNDYIYLHNPTVREVKKNEEKYFQLVQAITKRPYDDCVALDEAGINFQEFSDFDLFLKTAQTLTTDISSIIFGDLDFTKFELNVDVEQKKPILQYNDIIIDDIVFAYIATFVRKINFISSKREYDCGNEMMRKKFIESQQKKIKRAIKEAKLKGIYGIFESQLDGKISYCCNLAGFKYNYDTIQDIKISQLYDGYYRNNAIEDKNTYLRILATGMVKSSQDEAYRLDASRNLIED